MLLLLAGETYMSFISKFSSYSRKFPLKVYLFGIFIFCLRNFLFDWWDFGRGEIYFFLFDVNLDFCQILKKFRGKFLELGRLNCKIWGKFHYRILRVWFETSLNSQNWRKILLNSQKRIKNRNFTAKNTVSEAKSCFYNENSPKIH